MYHCQFAVLPNLLYIHMYHVLKIADKAILPLVSLFFDRSLTGQSTPGTNITPQKFYRSSLSPAVTPSPASR